MRPPTHVSAPSPSSRGSRLARLLPLLLALLAAALVLAPRPSRSTRRPAARAAAAAATEGAARLARLQAQQVDDMGFCNADTTAPAPVPAPAPAPASASASAPAPLLLLTAPPALSAPRVRGAVSRGSGRDASSPQCAGILSHSLDATWSARACRFFARRGADAADGIVRVCGRGFGPAERSRMCGRLSSGGAESAPRERVIDPYGRSAPQTFFFWNKALAAACDASPERMVDDGTSLPVEEYRARVGTTGAGARTFYVVMTQVGAFVQHIMPRITVPFVLVTGSSDFSAPLMSGSEGALATARAALDNPLLVAWFAQNPDMLHPKLVPVPIGIDYHTLAVPDRPGNEGRGHSWGEPTSVLRQEALLMELRCRMAPFYARPPRALMNFKLAGRDLRSRVHGLLSGVKGVEWVDGVKRHELWRMYGEFSFVVSPRGYGKDCHRTWEALSLGCAVIVSRDFHLRPLYDDLPVIQVERWETVTAEALLAWKAELERKWHTFRFEKLRTQFWLDAVRRASSEGNVSSLWAVRSFKNNRAGFASAAFVHDDM